MREAQFFMLDFLFERNEQDKISNIYNHPGMLPTYIIFLIAVNCNQFWVKQKKKRLSEIH